LQYAPLPLKVTEARLIKRIKLVASPKAHAFKSMRAGLPGDRVKKFNLLFFISLFWCSQAYSAVVTECGPNICYEYDDAQLAALNDEFGAPTLIGDDMRFLPLDFRAQSTDGVGIHSGTNTDNDADTFIFDRIYSVSGQEIALITVTESGDYDIDTDGSVSGDLLALFANNNDAIECDCITQEFNVSGDSSGLSLWSLEATFSPSAFFSSTANDVALSIQNGLTAFSDASGEDAFIQKKFSLVSVTLVPVPAAAWLFGSAILALGVSKRRLNSN